MTIMPPRYAFDLRPDRFDSRVMGAFQDIAKARRTYDRLVEGVRLGQYDDMLLKRLPGLEHLSDAANRKAALNVVDFYFEPIVLSSMALDQVRAYLATFERVMRRNVVDIGQGGPLWIDSVHHSCVFSALHQFAAHLGRERGYDRLILLHQGQRPEPRLGVMARTLPSVCGVRPTYIPLTGNWMTVLSGAMTLNTAIFYLADMPKEVSTRKAPKERAATWLELAVAPGSVIRAEVLSASAALARRLGCQHIVMDYPEGDRVALRPYDPDFPVLRCPVEDWVFWPLLEAVA